MRSVGELFVAKGMLSGELLDSYQYGGYYKEERGVLTILFINTLIYSTHRPRAPDEALPEDPFRQLAWLRTSLAAAAASGRSVWIVGHIPPGIETYGNTENWHSEYLEAYRTVLNPHIDGTVAAQLFGHTHSDEFRLWPGAQAGAGPMLQTGVVSPVYHSNPSFRLVEYDPETGRLLNYLVYYNDMQDSATAQEWR